MSKKDNKKNDQLRSIAFRGIPTKLLDNLIEGCQVISYEYKYLYLNKAALDQSHLGKDDLLGYTMMECYPGIENTRMFSVLRQCMENRTYEQMENKFTYADGTSGWFELRFEPVPEGVFILSVDRTKRKETEKNLRSMEEQLRQSQKMEAIGLLAAGLAHDFNNLLTIINICSDIILKTMPSTNAVYKRVEQIQGAGQRASSLTDKLLSFSRQQVSNPKIFNMNTLIHNMEEMIRRLIDEDIQIILTLKSDINNIKADPGHIEQIIMNLIVNAKDAMPDGGTLTIETQNVNLDSTYTANHLEVEPGPYVMLSISDTGVGMSKTTLSHIFEPFYTTKEPGKGSGLGLATVFGIVKQNNGSIWVYSEPGQGAVFKVYLPAEKGRISPVKPGIKQKSIKGNETILLVEDEADVREITVTALQMYGYTVLPAANFDEAVNVYKNNKDHIAILITDVVMPGTSGRKVVEKIHSFDPGIKVLYMSGYTDDAVVRQGIIKKEVAFIQKPFSAESLATKVRRVLES